MRITCHAPRVTLVLFMLLSTVVALGHVHVPVGAPVSAPVGEWVGELMHPTTEFAHQPSAHAKLTELKAAMPFLATASRMRFIALNREALRAADVFVLKNKIQRSATNLVPNATPPVLPIIRVAFFDDVVLDIEINRQERTLSGGLALSGRIAGDAASSAVLVDNDGVVTILVASGSNKYAIYGSAVQGYVATQLPENENLPDLHNDAIKIPTLAPVSVLDDTTRAPNNALVSKSNASLANVLADKGTGQIIRKDASPADDGSSIDLMILYTPAARIASGGVAQMNANVDAQVASVNAMYERSNVVQRLRLVYRGEITHTEGDAFSDLYGFATGKIGEEANTLRAIYQADLVSVWGLWPQVCGLAFQPLTESLDNARYGYSLVNAPVCTGAGSVVVAHELGHNMGLYHDPDTRPGTSQVTPEGSNTLTTIGYAHGYVDSINRFRTVMSYDPCVSLGYFCTVIPYFSNPLLVYDNTGAYAPAIPAALGSFDAGNERQALNDTRDTIANYRAALTAPLPAAGVVSLISYGSQVGSLVGSVVLKIQRYAGSVGAISIDYATSIVSSRNQPAPPPTHYTPVSGTLTWADGDATPKTITIPILSAGNLGYTELFYFTLSNVTGGATIAQGTTYVQITETAPDPYPPGGAFPGGFVTPASSAGAWTVDLSVGNNSTSSLGSAAVYGTVPQPGVSDLEYTGVFSAGYVSFAHLVSGRAAASSLQFMVDNVVVFTQVGGQNRLSHT